MGGHAFHDLNCPRISASVYHKVKLQTTAALKHVFSHVVVPTEMPEKPDYGDIDFLVASPIHSPTSTNIDNFDWPGTVLALKQILHTAHGRRGLLNPDCMYFAIRAPGHESDFWVQVDVKVCFKAELFEWQAFELNYASNSKMIGSMVKPLGLTIDPEGLHVRVEEIEATNFPGSMVWVSKDPRDVLRITGLDRRILDAGFEMKDEIYEYFTGSWLFNPAHFAARLAEEQYSNRLEDRAPHWTYFIKEWVPKHYPGYKFIVEANTHNDSSEDPEEESKKLQDWYNLTRVAVREKVFTMFPHVAAEYYTKRAVHIKEQEEQRLRDMITAAIPTSVQGWKDDLPQPRIIVVKQSSEEATTPELKPTAAGELTPPMTPFDETHKEDVALSNFILLSPTSASLSAQTREPWDIPLYLEFLPRTPPLTCTPRPPPANMSPEAKLTCLARWTLFSPSTGTPYLLSAPRDKDFTMAWADATYSGAQDNILVKWASDMWWHIWIRQSHTNYVGMWKKRFEKEDRKAKQQREEDEVKAKAEADIVASREKVLKRLCAMNVKLGLVERG